MKKLKDIASLLWFIFLIRVHISWILSRREIIRKEMDKRLGSTAPQISVWNKKAWARTYQTKYWKKKKTIKFLSRVTTSLIPPLGFLRFFLFFFVLCKMANDVITCLENMKLTSEEEEVILTSDEGRRDRWNREMQSKSDW